MNTINVRKYPKDFFLSQFLFWFSESSVTSKTIRKTEFLLRKQLIRVLELCTFTKNYTSDLNPKYMASINTVLLICFSKITVHFKD